MILEGNERAFGAELARHLLNPRDNDHVTVHAVEGFMTQDLGEAFAEVEAIASGTKCKKYLFSLSLNPPPHETVDVPTFETAIKDVEARLGLTGQPRAIVFHEKNGRRHAHCVWSKIDASQMKAINLSHYKRKLTGLSREIYIAQDWDMPDGFKDPAQRDPLNYTRQEAGQAKRTKRDPKALKAMFRKCWERSDNRTSFAAALQEQGFVLARGTRRGFVGVDGDGKVWSLSRWCDVRPKDMRKRLGPEADLPSVEDVLAQARGLPKQKQPEPSPDFQTRRDDLVARQRLERAELVQRQEADRIAALKAQKEAQRNGLKSLFHRITGQRQKIIERAEAQAKEARDKARADQHALIERHLSERRALDLDAQKRDLGPIFSRANDPRQTLNDKRDDLPFSKAQLQQDPALVLDHISHTKAEFSRADVLRALAKRIDKPAELQEAAAKALKSPELIRLNTGTLPRFTTRDYRAAEDSLQQSTNDLSNKTGFAVDQRHVSKAISDQDKRMTRAFGGRLSAEQRAGLQLILGANRLSCVVGLAGAGKSTLLDTARDAWQRQGLVVHGAALAGKAADGLQEASGIPSRTLASLELSWKNGHEPIKSGEVLVVDEAGMIGTRQMARVAAKMNEIGAKLVLVGDPDQLQPIEAGKPFRDVIDQHGAAQLTEIHRQREDWQKQASKELAEGRSDKALQRYADRNAVSESNNLDENIERLVQAYRLDVAVNGNDTSRLAFAHKRRDVFALNQAIRAALREDQDTPPIEQLYQTDTGKRAFATGDRLVFGKNDKDLGIKNGMLGTVEQAGLDELCIRLDGDHPRKIRFNPHTYQSFDHGYAVTVHKSQGATVDHAYVLASRSMDQHLAYVAMTRHRDQLQVFVDRCDRPTWAHPSREPEPRKRDGPDHSGPSWG